MVERVTGRPDALPLRRGLEQGSRVGPGAAVHGLRPEHSGSLRQQPVAHLGGTAASQRGDDLRPCFALLVRFAPLGRISGDETKEKRLVRRAHREKGRMPVLLFGSESL